MILTNRLLKRLTIVMALGAMLAVIAACGAGSSSSTADASDSASASGDGDSTAAVSKKIGNETGDIDALVDIPPKDKDSGEVVSGFVTLPNTPFQGLASSDGDYSYSRVYIQKENNVAVSKRTIPVAISTGDFTNVALTVKVKDSSGSYVTSDAVTAEIANGAIQFTFAEGRYAYDEDHIGLMYNDANNNGISELGELDEYRDSLSSGGVFVDGNYLLLEIQSGEQVIEVPLSVLPTLAGSYESHAIGKAFGDTGYTYLRSWTEPTSIAIERYAKREVSTGGVPALADERAVQDGGSEKVEVVDLRAVTLSAESSNLFRINLGEKLDPLTGNVVPLPSNTDLVITNTNPDNFKVVAYIGNASIYENSLNIAVFPTKAGEVAVLNVSLKSNPDVSTEFAVASIPAQDSLALVSLDPVVLKTSLKGQTVEFKYATKNLPEGAVVKLFESVDNDGTTYFFDGLNGITGEADNNGVITFTATVKDQENYLPSTEALSHFAYVEVYAVAYDAAGNVLKYDNTNVAIGAVDLLLVTN